MPKITPFTIALLGICLTPAVAAPHDLTLWYDKPAEDWQQQALPLGNGSLGCMVFGGVETEHIQFNHDTLWVGSEKDTGSYQAFGDIFITHTHSESQDYRRQLDITTAVQTITYLSNGTSYKREYFASNPDQVMVFRFSADKKAAHSGTIRLTDAHGAPTVAHDNNRLSATGDTTNYQHYWNENAIWPDPVILNFESQVLALNEGGTVRTDQNTITFENCDSLTILVAAGTDYLNQRDKGWKGEHPHRKVSANLQAAAKKSHAELLNDHINDYQSLFNRVSLDIGTTPVEIAQLPTDARMQSYRGDAPAPGEEIIYEATAAGVVGKPDPDLEELLFQYARYLIISCSRQGNMPANLQGLWNNSNRPPWRSDYHSDVNTQMNYWFVDHANLSECFSPLSEWLFSIKEVRREQTWEHFKNRGFALRAENGVFGGSTHRWSVGDASWLANNIWDHYAYTLDEEYLKTRAYPIMKDLFMFWEDHLKEIPAPDGKGTVLVAPDGWSPEHGPKEEDGVSFDQQLAWDLLSNFAKASEILGVDEKERAKAIQMRDQLLGPQIGKWGQIMEWMVDRDDPNNKHRHLSHLIAVHPGRQISPLTTPELAEAAKVSMNARGDGATGWSKAWKINMWARLHDGNRAHKLLREMISGNVYDNLYDAHPPFQIDGNFGYASGVCEMLVQSHIGQIHLLPALPDAWSDGSASGLKARGAFVIDMQWQNKALTTGRIHSQKGGECILRTATPVNVTHQGQPVAAKQLGEGVISFPTTAGQDYLIEAE